MCGILGVIGDAPLRPERFDAARDLMVHRGPDDAGSFSSGPAHLGFRRLAILDLSSAGHQPMTALDGQVALAFNGEIYNYRALRDELQSDLPFHSDTDSEVLLNGYLAWGWDRLLKRIEGMFAFVIWDARSQTLYGARDRAGKKPFYYTEQPQSLAFASTLNALRALLPTSPSVNDAALDAYLTYQAVPSPLTMFEGLYQLPPAHELQYHVPTQRLDVNRYWKVRFTNKLSVTEDDALDALDDLVRTAVRKRLVSDVPLGAFLSGGVDSSLVVAMMAQEQSRPVEAVVMGFDDPAYDERPYARQVADRWNVNLHEHILRPNAIADLPEIIWQYGQPLADVSIVPTYYVAQAAKQHVTVVLNGDGGDEVFGGYARPMVARAAQSYRRFLPKMVRQMLGRSLNGLADDRYGALLKRVGMLADAGAGSARDSFVYDRAFRTYRETAYTPALHRSVAEKHPDTWYRTVWSQAEGQDDVDRALYGDFTTYLPDQLLTKMDVSTMAHAVEARSPLLDKDLIEYAARLPTSLRLHGYTTKYLLKRLAERYVPHEVLYRRKRGFVMPASDWLRGELAPYVRAALDSDHFFDRGWILPSFVRRMLDEHRHHTQDWGEQLWTLFVLELWARQTLDGTLSRSDSLDALFQ
ncbi:asparagine synthase (glutamine-hydrolyzing) [Salinibacter sp. 10B]|uniref:asparagine synthase (glutamine-hydrolyzing) n=1 Tax=Salinibacter sp. 10B TaxID=1923971 RepID=UPI000CF47973|nr:asparagine synthase (glutamine-hydrolyzing) [Salinibacter sp. 10B]PQJ34591.1 asparagine synthase (glutamine-hydrolyzing) [Salinibacter sp. 10B]